MCIKLKSYALLKGGLTLYLTIMIFRDLEKDAFRKHWGKRRQEDHDGPVTLHWLICEIPSYKTLQYLGIGLKHKTPNKD